MTPEQIRWVRAAAQEHRASVVLIRTAGGTQALLLPRRRGNQPGPTWPRRAGEGPVTRTRPLPQLEPDS